MTNFLNRELSKIYQMIPKINFTILLSLWIELPVVIEYPNTLHIYLLIRVSNSKYCRKNNLKWHILLIEKQETVEEENPFSLDANSGGAASASVSETVKNTDSGEYGKRTVASNWTKYEMPPSDSEDDENIIGTGPDFQFVLENSAKASEHLQLKAEKEWETKHQEFNNEFFALNLNSLESKIDCIPLYKVLQIEKEELEDVGLISVFYPYIHNLCIYWGVKHLLSLLKIF